MLNLQLFIASLKVHYATFSVGTVREGGRSANENLPSAYQLHVRWLEVEAPRRVFHFYAIFHHLRLWWSIIERRVERARRTKKCFRAENLWIFAYLFDGFSFRFVELEASTQFAHSDHSQHCPRLLGMHVKPNRAEEAWNVLINMILW